MWAVSCLLLALLHPALPSPPPHALRHQRRDTRRLPPDKREVRWRGEDSGVPATPCELPAITSESFVRQCTNVFHKRFACMQSGVGVVSQTTMNDVEDMGKGQLAFCAYDPVRRRVEQRPLGDDILIRAYQRKQAKKDQEEKRKKDQGIQGHPPGTKNREPKLSSLLRPPNRRFRVAIAIMERYEGLSESYQPTSQWLHSTIRQVGERCRTQSYLVEQLYNVSGRDEFRERLFQIYAAEVRQLWSLDKCQTDLAILVMGTPAGPENKIYAAEVRQLWSLDKCQTDLAILVMGTPAGPENKVRPVLVVSLSGEAERVMGGVIRNMTRGVNADEALSTAGQKLRGFFARLMGEYERLHPAFPSRKLHRIPTWAVWAFVTCGLVSLCATLVGNFVAQSDRRQSGASVALGKKPAGRSGFGAGFSGGMWNK